jgi:3-deoxy-D-manno-octulosonate 8-phosphate phosphatase KdsC-like HAD superfamily phosphatase
VIVIGVRVVVDPIISGAGLSVKVAEAIANAVPVIVLQLAAKGFEGDVLTVAEIYVAADYNEWVFDPERMGC